MQGEKRLLRQWAWRPCPTGRGSRTRFGLAGKRDDFDNTEQQSWYGQERDRGDAASQLVRVVRSWRVIESSKIHSIHKEEIFSSQRQPRTGARLCCHQPWWLSNPN